MSSVKIKLRGIFDCIFKFVLPLQKIQTREMHIFFFLPHEHYRHHTIISSPDPKGHIAIFWYPSLQSLWVFFVDQMYTKERRGPKDVKRVCPYIWV